MLSWDDLRLFLAVVRGKSLSSAARTLGVTQPTMGRRLASFEKRLGTRLLRRTLHGFELTTAGREVLRHVESMEACALTVERVARGRDEALAGPVRVTSTEWFGRKVLAPLFARFAIAHPAIAVELVTDLRLFSLAQREADVAVRLGSFTQGDVVRRKLALVTFGLYAEAEYLARRGTPDFARAGDGHSVVLMTEAFPDTTWLQRIAPRAHVAFRTNSREAQAAVAAAGAGLVTLPRFLGDAFPSLRRLQTPSAVPDRVAWAGVHRDTRGTPRVRALVDFLTIEVGRLAPRLGPTR
jgi:DNA-binding transcriptional LysR family regulator